MLKFLARIAGDSHPIVPNVARLCLKSKQSHLDRVSTGSGSDLVSDQHAIFANDS